MPPESIDLTLSIVVKAKQAIHVHMSHTTQERCFRHPESVFSSELPDLTTYFADEGLAWMEHIQQQGTLLGQAGIGLPTRREQVTVTFSLGAIFFAPSIFLACLLCPHLPLLEIAAPRREQV